MQGGQPKIRFALSASWTPYTFGSVRERSGLGRKFKARVSNGFFGIFLRFLDFFQAQIMSF